MKYFVIVNNRNVLSTENASEVRKLAKNIRFTYDIGDDFEIDTDTDGMEVMFITIPVAKIIEVAMKV